MADPAIVVEVKSGNVINVFSSQGGHVVVVDWDNMSVGGGDPAFVGADDWSKMDQSTLDKVRGSGVLDPGVLRDIASVEEAVMGEMSEPVFVIDHKSPDFVLVRGEKAHVQPAGMRLLVLLAENAQKVVRYEDVENALFGVDGYGQRCWHIHRLRSALKPVGVEIETIPRVGFRLNLRREEVEIVEKPYLGP